MEMDDELTDDGFVLLEVMEDTPPPLPDEKDIDQLNQTETKEIGEKTNETENLIDLASPLMQKEDETNLDSKSTGMEKQDKKESDNLLRSQASTPQSGNSGEYDLRDIPIETKAKHLSEVNDIIHDTTTVLPDTDNLHSSQRHLSRKENEETERKTLNEPETLSNEKSCQNEEVGEPNKVVGQQAVEVTDASFVENELRTLAPTSQLEPINTSSTDSYAFDVGQVSPCLEEREFCLAEEEKVENTKGEREDDEKKHDKEEEREKPEEADQHTYPYEEPGTEEVSESSNKEETLDDSDEEYMRRVDAYTAQCIEESIKRRNEEKAENREKVNGFIHQQYKDSMKSSDEEETVYLFNNYNHPPFEEEGNELTGSSAKQKIEGQTQLQAGASARAFTEYRKKANRQQFEDSSDQEESDEEEADEEEIEYLKKVDNYTRQLFEVKRNEELSQSSVKPDDMSSYKNAADRHSEAQNRDCALKQHEQNCDGKCATTSNYNTVAAKIDTADKKHKTHTDEKCPEESTLLHQQENIAKLTKDEEQSKTVTAKESKVVTRNIATHQAGVEASIKDKYLKNSHEYSPDRNSNRSRKLNSSSSDSSIPPPKSPAKKKSSRSSKTKETDEQKQKRLAEEERLSKEFLDALDPQEIEADDLQHRWNHMMAERMKKERQELERTRQTDDSARLYREYDTRQGIHQPLENPAYDSVRHRSNDNHSQVITPSRQEYNQPEMRNPHNVHHERAPSQQQLQCYQPHPQQQQSNIQARPHLQYYQPQQQSANYQAHHQSDCRQPQQQSPLYPAHQQTVHHQPQQQLQHYPVQQNLQYSQPDYSDYGQPVPDPAKAMKPPIQRPIEPPQPCAPNPQYGTAQNSMVPYSAAQYGMIQPNYGTNAGGVVNRDYNPHQNYRGKNMEYQRRYFPSITIERRSLESDRMLRIIEYLQACQRSNLPVYHSTFYEYPNQIPPEFDLMGFIITAMGHAVRVTPVHVNGIQTYLFTLV